MKAAIFEVLGAAGGLVAIFVPLIMVLSGKQWRAAQERERARRLTDARMNARLLRLDI
jgi:hypothetical protein